MTAVWAGFGLADNLKFNSLRDVGSLEKVFLS